MSSSQPQDGPARDQQRARQLGAAFERAFARAPSGVWAAPGRVNLIGEHTDYNQGYVFPLALEQSAYVAVAPRDDETLNLHSTQFDPVSIQLSQVKPGGVKGWGGYLAGSVWALAEGGARVGGIDLLLDSDVPVGAGLSSSAAIECATAIAVAELFNNSLDAKTLALAAHRAEFEIVGMPCGIMDQMISACARADHALLLDCRSVETTHIPLGLDAAALTLLVIDTKAPHQLVDGEYAARRSSCESAAQALGLTALRDADQELLESAGAKLDAVQLRRARHVVSEDARVLQTVELLKRGALAEIGPLLIDSHNSLRDDFEVTVPELDVAVEAALAAGALGARMTGGGFGGCVIALVPKDATDQVLAQVTQAFAQRGFNPPVSFHAKASQGARRIA